MRQDPKYFAIYYALRPDRNINFISYPYYTKYTYKGDNTFFRYIDLNIRDLAASNRSTNIIQGIVSLNNESEDNYTMILPSIYKYIKE